MATLVLSAAGAAVGGLFGPVGAALGRAAGAAAGYAIDQSLFSERRTVESGRLGDLDIQTSREGAPIPRVYGRVRIAGQVIWATRFEEEVSKETQGGGKGGSSGGTTVKTYSYYANFAVALCEGRIDRINRVWADGRPFNMVAADFRIHNGGENQDRDSLIEAKQGGSETPAYRGTAYIVFERLPLEDYGNRIPLLSFEVIRAVGQLEKDVRAVTMIPGATEFGYSPTSVKEIKSPGHKVPLTRHTDRRHTDWDTSLSELKSLCPNLERVGLVVAWFGNDLRANHCTIKPAVTNRDIKTTVDWKAGGLTRATARLVSQYQGKPAYGGTPSDASVIAAIRNLDNNGLKITFIPFVMMDIAAGNGLTDPYGGAEQGAYPWRGVITGSRAPGVDGTPDQTATAADQIDAFVGTASPGDFALDGDTVVYSGPDEWSFRRLILHNAWLCKAAGGVDAFLLGSELRGLTTLRSGTSSYPFVEALVDLAADVRDVLGPSVKLSYGADWTEYFGHQPADGSGDVHFHLDPLWASDDIDAVAIDNYMPLADWRDGSDHADAAIWENGRSADYFRANVAAGEGFDWFYASPGDRDAQTRTAITDGAYGKPWVFRYKDLKSWWRNQHRNRPGGVEAGSPTGWVPESKPFWFTELGCPAVDKGANQPNVFLDPKSSASASPCYSTGARDDLVQRRFLEAALSFFDPTHAAYAGDSNPVSSVYGGRMVKEGMTHLWTWDARPYPAFPYLTDVWSDGENWTLGHWLTGRLGSAPAADLVAKILDDYGIDDVAVGELDGIVDGYLIDGLTSARGALEPLASLLMFEALESTDVIRFVRRARKAVAAFGESDLAEDSGQPLVTVRRAQETELPAEISVGFDDPLADFRSTAASARRLVTGSGRSQSRATGVAMSHGVATGLAEAALQDLWAGRETYGLSLTGKTLSLEPADVCDLTADGVTRTLLVTRIEDGLVRRIEARSIEPALLSPPPAGPRVLLPPTAMVASAPEMMFLDLPLLGDDGPGYAPRVAAFATPWTGPLAIAIGTAGAGFVPRQAIERRAAMGELTMALPAGPVGRWDRANTIEVTLYGGALSALPEAAVLNGGNAAAIGTSETGFEVVQFETATMLDGTTWRLEGLLRGQGGTGDVAAAGHEVGARFVLLDGAIETLDLGEAESGLGLTARCGAAGAVYDPDDFVDITLTPARRGLACLPPVHLDAERDPATGDVAIGWIRQTRIGGDAWEQVEVPLGETSEAYRVEILDAGVPVRAIAVGAPEAAYSAAEQAADFGAPPASLHIRVSQVSPTEGPGRATEGVFDV
ncbi:baseplate multidomain protein megatron [Bauldia litoralis]|uniref:Putative phage tail protein n=1 Tax=Bauldia litoralis TaxID=665467 RepID=A0A1G6CFI9_9HYPH|nr:glycoside hydrolase/phage tail family protein [Bauldia litoralis]SDB31637.1 Putative phage tail protein [Bauldia litoralis]